MKKMLLVIGVLLLVFGTTNAQSTTKPDSSNTTIEKAELIKKLEAEKKVLEEAINQRVLYLVVNDPAAKQRVDQLIATDAFYNQKIGELINCQKYLKEIKPTEQKHEVKK